MRLRVNWWLLIAFNYSTGCWRVLFIWLLSSQLQVVEIYFYCCGYKMTRWANLAGLCSRNCTWTGFVASMLISKYPSFRISYFFTSMAILSVWALWTLMKTFIHLLFISIFDQRRVANIQWLNMRAIIADESSWNCKTICWLCLLSDVDIKHFVWQHSNHSHYRKPAW